MVDMLERQCRTLSGILEVALSFSLHLPIHLGNSYGFRRSRMLSHLGEMVGTLDKELDPIILTKEVIVTETTDKEKTEILGGTLAENGIQPTIVRTEILGGTSLLGGTKTRPNGIGTVVRLGTLTNRPRKGAIENVTVLPPRVIIRQPA